MNILIVEDDAETVECLAKELRDRHHTVEIADDGAAGLALARSAAHDILIVDRMLPVIDGLSIVRTLRDAGIATPVLVLTTLGGIDDRVEGLEAGADDYLCKPFALAELSARINALARRPPLSAETSLCVADLKIDLLKRTVSRGGQRLDIQPREFRLLEYLMRNAGRVVTRTMLLEQVWGFHFDPKTNIVETHISRLRAKIDRDFTPELIQTVRGAGYLLRASS
jgi:two-component system OmpR family response regulator